MFAHFVALVASLAFSLVFLARLYWGRIDLFEVERTVLDWVHDELTLREALWAVWWSPESQDRLRGCWEDWQREQRLARLRGE